MKRTLARTLSTLALIAALTVPHSSCGSVAEEAEPRKEGNGTVIVTVTGLPNDEGQVLINLFLGPRGFPSDPKLAFAGAKRPIRNGTATARFERVPAGPIAISAFHDQDMDEVLDTNLFGIPSENWGVSRDASGFMGPPSYDDAKLELESGEELRIEVKTG